MQQQIIPISKPDKLVEAGFACWDTLGKVQWAFRRRHENGLVGAFVRIGRSVYVDTQKAHEILRQLPAA